MSSSKIIEKSDSDSDGEVLNTPPPRRPAARAHIPGSNALHSSITSIKSEHCRVHSNSIKFRNDEPEWYEDSSFSGESNGCSSREMEVMDLRPSDHHAVHHMDTSSLVSLGSKSSTQSSSRSLSKASNEFKEASGLSELKFSKLPSSLFHVASSSNVIADCGRDRLASDSEGSIRFIKPGPNSPPLSPVPGQMRGDMPTHWEEANGNNDEGDEHHRHDSSGESNHHSSSDSNPHHRRRRPNRRQNSLSLRISNNGRFLLGESEQAYRTLMSLMSASGNGNLARGYPSSSESGMGEDESSSLVSHSDSNGSRSSGFWSELGDVARSITGSHDDSDLTENSPSSKERRRRRQLRRKLYVKRCVRGMVGVVALSMLSMSAIYFLTEDGQLILSMNFLGEMLSGEHVNSTEGGEHQHNQWELSETTESESEVDSQLRVRELIKGKENTFTMTEHIGLLVDVAELVADELEVSIKEMGQPSPQERDLEAQLRQDYHDDFNAYQEYHQEYGEYPIEKDGRINEMH